MSDDDRPTPDLGYPAQPDPFRAMPTRQSRARILTPADDAEQARLSALVGMHIRRHLRGPRKLIAAALIAAVGSLGGLVIKLLDSREQAGGDKVRQEVLRRDHDALQGRFDELLRDLRRARDRVDQPAPPATKGP